MDTRVVGCVVSGVCNLGLGMREILLKGTGGMEGIDGRRENGRDWRGREDKKGRRVSVINPLSGAPSPLSSCPPQQLMGKKCNARMLGFAGGGQQQGEDFKHIKTRRVQIHCMSVRISSTSAARHWPHQPRIDEI